MSEPRTNRLVCALVTLALWVYFVGGFVLGYAGVFVGSWLIARERGIRWAMRTYLRGFFGVLRGLYPRLTIAISEGERLRNVRGAILVSNHLSYLDPLLILAVIPNTTTIARSNLFRIPVFGWLLRMAGFVPSRMNEDSESWLTRVRQHLDCGANLLVFPEGTRSRNGVLGTFRTGAFFLARQLHRPIELLCIRGTEQVFEPGRFLFHIGPPTRIELTRIGKLEPLGSSDTTPLRDLSEQARRMYLPAMPSAPPPYSVARCRRLELAPDTLTHRSMPHRFAIIIPVYNHAEMAVQVAARASALGAPVIVVDDGSTDDLRDRLRQLPLRELPQIRVVSHERNLGKGAAILTGLVAAQPIADWGITIDADGQHDPADMPALLEAIAPHTRPLIVGRREGMLDNAKVPWTSRFGRGFSNFWVRAAGGPRISDSQSGFRIYPLPEALHWGTTSRRFQFEVEVLVRAHWHQVPIIEAPVTVTYSPPGGRVSHFRPFVDFCRNSAVFLRLIATRLLVRPFVRPFQPPVLRR